MANPMARFILKTMPRAVNGSPVVGNASKYITAPSVTLGPCNPWWVGESRVTQLVATAHDFADGQAQNSLYLALNNSNRYFSLAGYNSAVKCIVEMFQPRLSRQIVGTTSWRLLMLPRILPHSISMALPLVRPVTTPIYPPSRGQVIVWSHQWVSDSNRYLDGMLDMVTYNRALTADDVSRLYLHGHNLQLRQSYVMGTFSAFLSATIGVLLITITRGMVPVAQELLARKASAPPATTTVAQPASRVFVGTMLLTRVSSATTVMPATVMAVQTSAQLKRVTRVAVSPTPAKTLMSVSPIPTTAMPMPPVPTPRARLPVPVMQASVAMAPAARRPPRC